MLYWLHLTLFQMGFWITWTLIPIVVEIIPAIWSTGRLIIRQLHAPKLDQPQKWPMITVIVPVYNSADTLFACIRSLNEQTYPKDSLQVILANNQSTDDSFGAFAEAQNKFPELILRYVNTDKGKATALNTAIYQSIGTYVINIDSDGELEAHALENMVLRFENDPDIAAMTGSILPRHDLVSAIKKPFHKLLAQNEYYEYAQAFLSGRTIESEHDQLFTMSGAFSAFRREVLMDTFLYDTDTIGEDTDMTFQIRTRLGKKVVICAEAIFYIEPISGLNELYTQRQRWQRGEMEVAANYMQHTAKLQLFFKNFLIRRMMVDHTFLFPKMIWMCASVVLIQFGYPAGTMALSYVLIYGLYVFVSLIDFASVLLILRPHPDERHYYSSLWWVAFTLPVYNMLCSGIRLVGIINGMTTKASWQLRGFDQETQQVKAVLKDDLRELREHHDEEK
ncbi:TIGR03111 family XrtG-associated glycosyltransferase [Lacticaseibacillus zhaodongensis]|uniref:TIGR03111 family XrtG-associated glycosyltransferase n=1 Tax=Lacticaseibacillus zhaodongensis TaxID=2668065 RepID=UPI0012D2EE89|nr:TIGR03111 family XrtG-associated glycosyltransferase [Lacticaseibacillus zhaodongensis]